jgi:hypothetical protein
MISSELNLNHRTIYDILTKELDMQTLGCCMTTTLPINTAISMEEVLTKKGIPVVPMPPYPYWVRVTCSFSQNSNSTSGRHFETVDYIQKVVTDQPRALPALLPGVGTTSPAVCAFPRELL